MYQVLRTKPGPTATRQKRFVRSTWYVAQTILLSQSMDADFFERNHRLVVMLLQPDVSRFRPRTPIWFIILLLRRHRRHAVVIGHDYAVHFHDRSQTVERNVHGVPLTGRLIRPRLRLGHGVENAGTMPIVVAVVDLHLDAFVDGIALRFGRLRNADEHSGVALLVRHFVHHANRRIADFLAGVPQQPLTLAGLHHAIPDDEATLSGFPSQEYPPIQVLAVETLPGGIGRSVCA